MSAVCDFANRKVEAMIDIDAFTEMADEIANDLPAEFYRQLNGGVLILERCKAHPQSRPEAPLYIMGEYTHSRMMGRYIAIYYGSFARTYGNFPEDKLREKLRETIVHEFRHHMESLSGRRELEIEDARQLAEYRAKHCGRKE